MAIETGEENCQEHWQVVPQKAKVNKRSGHQTPQKFMLIEEHGELRPSIQVKQRDITLKSACNLLLSLLKTDKNRTNTFSHTPTLT